MEDEKVQFSDIDMTELKAEWDTSQAYVYQYTQDFQALDNLVDAIPVIKENDAPFIGDTTVAGLVRSIPRAAFKDLPVLGVSLNGSKTTVDALFCKYLLRAKIFNEDTFGKGIISTIRIGTEQAITRGFAPFLAAGESLYKDFGTRLRLVHFSDIGIEPGLTDSGESSYAYISTNLPKSAIRKILNSAEAEEDSTWNIDALKQLLQTEPQMKSYARYESAARVNNSGQNFGRTYQIVTRYEVGPKPTYVTFAVDMPDQPLRIVQTKSKWGFPRLTMLVIDPAQLSPFGISRVRLASPIQSLINIYLGNIAYMLLLNSNPPIFKSGTFLKTPQLKRGALWEALDPSAKIEMMTMDNGTLAQFPTIIEQLQGQIQNIMGGNTITVNSGNQNSGFSKTAPGVKQSQEYLNNEVNQITKILDNFLREYGLSALDTYLCEKSGQEMVIVDDEAKQEMNMVAPGVVNDENQMFMDWDAFYENIKEWSVEVDVSTSKDELKDKELSDVQDLITTLSQTNDGSPGIMNVVNQASNALIKEKMPLLNAEIPLIPEQPQMLDNQLTPTEQPM